jgi:hypothetical protein
MPLPVLLLLPAPLAALLLLLGVMQSTSVKE